MFSFIHSVSQSVSQSVIRSFLNSLINNHVKDLETGDIQYADEELAFVLGVQSLVDTLHQPFEHAVVQGLGQGRHRVGDLHTNT